MFLRLPEREELKFVIVKRMAADANRPEPHADK
jgi:hypothetical protein